MKKKEVIKELASKLNMAGVEKLLIDLDQSQCHLADLTAEKREKINAIETEYVERQVMAMRDVSEYREIIEAWLESHSKLFADNPRSLDFDCGTIGFRLGQKQLKPLSKMTWEKVRAALEKEGAERFLRRAVEIDKVALVSAVQKDELSIDTVKSFGLRIVQEDRPFVETAYQKRVAALAKKD